MTGLAFALLFATATARATVDKTTVHVGETFAVDVVADGPAGTAFSFPPDAGNEAVELHAVPSRPGASPPPPGTQRYQGTTFALGDAELPSIAVPFRLPDGSEGTAATAPVKLRVESVLPKDPKQQKLVDIKGPLPLAIGAPFWIAAGTLGLVLAAGVWLWGRRKGAPEAATPAPPPVAPDVEALAALDRLAGSGLTERGEYRAYYIALTDVAKRYLERRLAAPVLEMTTAEMAAYLRDHRDAAPFAGTMRELASAADQIKFARGQGLADEAKRHLDAARRLVRDLEQRLRPAPAPEGKVA